MDKNKVCASYDKIVDWYDSNRDKTLMEKEYLNLIVDSIPAGGSILDLGCGTGMPISDFFIQKKYKVMGIDGSEKMIALCKKRFPKEHWICVDMREMKLHEQFDAIIAWNSFFHIPQEDQRRLFPIFETHVESNGILAFTSGPEQGEVWGDNGGESLYHASLSQDEYSALLEKHYFKIIRHVVQDQHCGNTTVWIAKKI